MKQLLIDYLGLNPEHNIEYTTRTYKYAERVDVIVKVTKWSTEFTTIPVRITVKDYEIPLTDILKFMYEKILFCRS